MPTNEEPLVEQEELAGRVRLELADDAGKRAGEEQRPKGFPPGLLDTCLRPELCHDVPKTCTSGIALDHPGKQVQEELCGCLHHGLVRHCVLAVLEIDMHGQEIGIVPVPLHALPECLDDLRNAPSGADTVWPQCHKNSCGIAADHDGVGNKDNVVQLEHLPHCDWVNTMVELEEGYEAGTGKLALARLHLWGTVSKEQHQVSKGLLKLAAALC